MQEKGRVSYKQIILILLFSRYTFKLGTLIGNFSSLRSGRSFNTLSGLSTSPIKTEEAE